MSDVGNVGDERSDAKAEAKKGDAGKRASPAQAPKCPRCQGDRCTAVRGSHLSAHGRRRWRECQTCGWTFTTMQPHGSTREEIVF